ncbi:MAG: hypothetical protein QM749_11560 [Aquabacterium sp.]
MDAQLWRLTWALPLVIAMGIGLIYWLKRMGVGQAPSAVSPQARLVSSTSVSEHTRVLVIDIDGQQFAVMESTAHIAVQTLDAVAHPLAGRKWDKGQALSTVFPWRPVRREP